MKIDCRLFRTQTYTQTHTQMNQFTWNFNLKLINSLLMRLFSLLLLYVYVYFFLLSVDDSLFFHSICDKYACVHICKRVSAFQRERRFWIIEMPLLILLLLFLFGLLVVINKFPNCIQVHLLSVRIDHLYSRARARAHTHTSVSYVNTL